MRKALVVRAGSAIGRALIEKLVAQGTETVAFSGSDRKLGRMKETYAQVPGFHTVSGKARNADDLALAAEGVDVIFYGVYLTYDDKPEAVNRITRAVVDVAARTGAKVVRIEGNYCPIEDSSHMDGPNMLRIQSPELYGAFAKNTFVHYTLKKIAQAKPVNLPGRPSAQREYLYIPDAASRIIDLASRDSAFGGSWKLNSGATISVERLAAIAGEAVGIQPHLKPIGGWKLRLLYRFDRRASQLLNRYEGIDQQIPDNSLAYDGYAPVTPYEIGIAETIRGMLAK
ncbi:NAD(P)H-binding protein [Cohnella luojiensis]|uniref:NAD(P)-binding domain-containing protein n=1 Tax=Cohnella luojiensis TaxID=652876 RepID=A0A4Y8LWV5_9BACL|nr:NAD(P)H-binding protein [Cohnella luojiensis]TFE25535.1 hypothetical protein E2980_13145 [Cohnella luojiensis]